MNIALLIILAIGLLGGAIELIGELSYRNRSSCLSNATITTEKKSKNAKLFS